MGQLVVAFDDLLLGEVEMAHAPLLMTILAFVLSTRIGRSRCRDTSSLPLLTWSFCATLVICLGAELQWSAILDWGMRKPDAIEHGEFYRLFTAFWFQAGGIVEGILNIAALAILGAAAEQALGRKLWLLSYFFGAIITELVALLWQPLGAGNSVGYMSLAGALFALACFWPRSKNDRLLGCVGFALGAALCLDYDIHGAAIFLGGVAFLVANLAGNAGLLRKQH